MSVNMKGKRPPANRPPAKPDAVTPEIKDAVAKAIGMARECGATRKAIIESLERIQHGGRDSEWQAREQKHAKGMAVHMERTAVDLIHAAKRIKGLATALQLKLDSEGPEFRDGQTPPELHRSRIYEWTYAGKSGYYAGSATSGHRRQAWIRKDGVEFVFTGVDQWNKILLSKEFQNQLDCFDYAESFLSRTGPFYSD